MAKSSTPPQLIFKDVHASGVKILSEEEGIVEAFVAGIGNKDSVGDIIQPGAFESAIERTHSEYKMPKGVWSHDWDRPVSKTLEIYEVEVGDSRLPTKMKGAGIGGLYVKTQFNLETQDGRDAFSWVKFYDNESEWSIGYQTLDEEFDKKKKANLLNEVKLFEYSPVLFGANPLTATVGVKVSVVSNEEENDVQIKIEGIEDDAKKEAVVAALEAAVAETLDTKEDDSGEEATSQKDDAVDGGETEVDTTEEAKSEQEEAENAEEVIADDASEKGPEGLDDPETTDEVADDVDEKEEDADDAEEETDEVETDAEEADDSDEVDEEDEKSAMSAVVDSFMTYAEKSEFTTAEAKALSNFVEERVEVKAVEGSFEQRLGSLNSALTKEFEDEDTFVYLYATFESTVVFYKTDFSTGDAGFYEAVYSDGDEGISFGDEKSVDVVEVVMAKNALMEAAFKGHADSVKAMLAPLVETADGVNADADIKQAMLDGIEAKAGAKLSKSNRGLIEDAVKALGKVLDAAVEDESDEKSEEDETEVKDEEVEVEVKDEEGSEESVDTEETLEETEDSEEESEKTVYTDDDIASMMEEIQSTAAEWLDS